MLAANKLARVLLGNSWFLGIQNYVRTKVIYQVRKQTLLR